jgi:cell division protein FtsW
MRKLKKGKVDKRFLWISLALMALGLLTYISTSLSIYTEDSGLFWSLMGRHLGLGVIGGLIAMYVTSHINFDFWKTYALYFFLGSLVLTLLVFIPGLGFSHGGAQRWVSLGFISFQPAEFLKLGVVIFLSAWFAKHARNVDEWKFGLLPFWVVTGLAFAVLFRQPDTGTMALIGLVAFALYWIRGARFKHIAITAVIAIALAGVYTALNPHVIDRIATFRDANRDPFGASYQVRQSKIAIGSGKLYGRGLGQSVHKFGPYLPESNSDSIFAVYAEEFGFLGSTLLLTLYILFAFFGAKVAKYAPTPFAQNLVIGILLLIIIQVFFNIAAISGMVPLSGLPLIFMSHGGTALFLTLASLGIVLNISRFMRVPKKRI